MIFRFPLLVLLAALGLGSSFTRVQLPQVVEKPRVIEFKAPTYPAIAHAAHAMGTVAVEVEIDPKGEVISARVLRGHPLLSATARQAALVWRFESSNERSINRRVELVFDFLPSDIAEVSVGPNNCRDGYSLVDSYHLKVYGYAKAFASSDTENDIPENLVGTLCKVHHEPLQRDKVEIVYGLTAFKPGYLKAEKKLFPNANTVTHAGCIIETQLDPCSGKEFQLSPKFSEVLYCAACRRAQARWSQAHPWPKS